MVAHTLARNAWNVNDVALWIRDMAFLEQTICFDQLDL